MEEEWKIQFRKAKRKLYREAKKNMVYRYKRYTAYCQVLAATDNEDIRKVYEFLEKDAAAYMAPVVISFAHCKLTPHTLKDKSLNLLYNLTSVAGEAMNASLLHAIRILLDRTSFYMHTAYNDCEIGNGIGSIEGNRKNGVMKFIDNQLNSNRALSENERLFFEYILKEHNEWFHKVVQVDNKTKHNLSAYDLYDVSKENNPLIPLPSSKGYYHDKELKGQKLIPVDFEVKYLSRAYDLFDKTLEFTTSIIVSKGSATE